MDIRYKWNTVRPPTNHMDMKQYTIRTSDRTSLDIAVNSFSSSRKRLIQENENTYKHSVVADDMNPMKNG